MSKKFDIDRFIEEHQKQLGVAADHAAAYLKSRNVMIRPFPEVDAVLDPSPSYCREAYVGILTEMIEKGSPFGFKQGLLIAAIPKKMDEESGTAHFEIRFGIFV